VPNYKIKSGVLFLFNNQDFLGVNKKLDLHTAAHQCFIQVFINHKPV